ncbi:MAG: 4Fe-4S cluster-binding domain-containing protein [Nitrospirae bacterium]|nr:4Fe-4S cluster-binding domain-containing protein [Nitrospirota bacterium]
MDDSLHQTEVGFKNLTIELYATEKEYYVFDAKNVIFIEVDPVVFAILGKLREKKLNTDDLFSILPQYSKSEIRDSLREVKKFQRKGYLISSHFNRDSRYDQSYFKHTLSNKLSGFTVYVTTQCNLSCSYCIYGGQYSRYQKLSQTSMTWKTAQNMVDFLITHSGQSEKIRLDFFGGEPLLAFDLIRQTVAYAKSRIGPDGPPIIITIASNGSILNDKILDFLLEHKVLLQFSIDGKIEIHDRDRRFRTINRGSFNLVISNLQKIYNHAPDYFRKCVQVKSVITMETLELEDDNFFNHPLIKILEEEGNLTMLIKEPHYDLERDSDYFDQLHRIGQRLLSLSGVKKLSELLRILNFRQKTFFYHTFNEFTEVQSVNKFYLCDSDNVPFRKGCLMGYQEGAVHPNGDITICHKATSFIIGNVNKGIWHFDKIWNLHSQLYKWPECQSCFVQRVCDLCYEKLHDGKAAWISTRVNFCKFTRKKYHLIFEYMLRILEKNPKLWIDLEKEVDIKIKDRLKQMEGEAQEEADKRV